MAKHIISVCVFCFLCATHSPCESHVGVNGIKERNLSSDIPYGTRDPLRIRKDVGDEKATLGSTTIDLNLERSSNLSKNISIDVQNSSYANKNNMEKQDAYLESIFETYSNGQVITKTGLARLLKDLSQVHEKHNQPHDQCDNSTEDLVITRSTFKEVCPILVRNALEGCKPHAHTHHDETSSTSTYWAGVWLYSTLSVIAISACGVLALAVIPIMQTRYYQQMLQFFVALAVSTLTGDALLHLLPHAMSGNHHHDKDTHHIHESNMWKGFTAMTGLIFFFIMEKFIVVAAKWRKAHQMKQKPPKVKIMKTEALQPATTSEKQCKHKYSSIPYCYNAIAMIDNNLKVEECPPGFRLLGGQDSIESHNETATTTLNDLGSDSDLDSFKKSHSACSKIETNQNVVLYKDNNSPDTPPVRNHSTAEVEAEPKDDSVEYTVILREHENRHHGHSHTHGHVHAPPKTMSSVAWMVIMGDGLHNFTDGMAIGAAFSNGIAGGFSTAVAVFCHELPHEMGDFAMLLKAGMTVKQALFYNMLSSILCLLGNVMGVYLGTGEGGSTWLFAVAAGMFIYIALVDMMPELSSGHDDDGTLVQHLLQIGGLLIGWAIMTLIALYEHDLKHIFLEPI